MCAAATSGDGRYEFTVLADNSARLVDFTPYVGSINNAGTVAFQAVLDDADHALCVAVEADTGAQFAALAQGAGLRAFSSHPDIDESGALSVYAERADGGQGLFLFSGDECICLADGRSGALNAIGPLGPTMNNRGEVAFRATMTDGNAVIAAATRQGMRIIAITGDAFREFHGLPVINDNGFVVFRADRGDGTEALYCRAAEGVVLVAESGGALQQISAFSSINNHGVIAFAATSTEGGAGVYTVAAGVHSERVAPDGAFSSIRGALINNAGELVFAGTRRGGTLGIHTPDCTLFCEGDELFDSRVESFALNPVSLNDRGQLAIRVRLHSGRQLILRADPLGRAATRIG